MPKLNLYVPHPMVKELWEQYAAKEKRTLSNFVRVAVEEKMNRMDEGSGK